MSYQRVIPRDLFNEADLLKCIGRLCLLIHDNDPSVKGLKMIEGRFDDEPNAPFNIRQNEADGSIFIDNIGFTFNDNSIFFCRPLNARGPWPLLVEPSGEHVFDVDGNVVRTTLENANA